MSYRRVIVADAVQARTVNGDPYLKLTLHSPLARFDHPSEAIRANCFHGDMFETIYGAKDSGVPVTLDIAEAKAVDHQKRPLLNVVGFEHPGQGILFSMGDE
jgi:hypothetical protein